MARLITDTLSISQRPSAWMVSTTFWRSAWPKNCARNCEGHCETVQATTKTKAHRTKFFIMRVPFVGLFFRERHMLNHDRHFHRRTAAAGQKSDGQRRLGRAG